MLAGVHRPPVIVLCTENGFDLIGDRGADFFTASVIEEMEKCHTANIREALGKR